MWFDTHLHLDPEDRPALLFAAARAVGVDRFLVAGTGLDDSRRAALTAAQEDGVVASAGVHPHEARLGLDLEAFRALLDEPRVVAVGEIGLDYHYNHSPPADQRRVFAAFLELAAAVDRPVIVHCRDAFDDCMAMLSEAAAAGVRILIHSFTGTPEQARRALEFGAMLSFNGMVTFNRAENIRAALAVVPVSRLLLETDSPYLAPVPHRGERNTPARVVEVGRRVAAEKGLPEAELASLTTANARRFFRLGDPD